jgi:hypothetical protein
MFSMAVFVIWAGRAAAESMVQSSICLLRCTASINLHRCARLDAHLLSASFESLRQLGDAVRFDRRSSSSTSIDVVHTDSRLFDIAESRAACRAARCARVRRTDAVRRAAAVPSCRWFVRSFVRSCLVKIILPSCDDNEMRSNCAIYLDRRSAHLCARCFCCQASRGARRRSSCRFANSMCCSRSFQSLCLFLRDIVNNNNAQQKR